MKRIFAVGAALALASSFAVAHGPGYGGGSGMMGGYGHGPGMMGGHGAGPGMMGGYGYGGVASLDLSDEQQEKVFAIQEEHRRKNWDTMGKMRAEQFKLRRMYYADEADPKAVSEQQKKVDELRRQLLVTRLEVRKQIEAVLTPEQRKQVRQFGPWWASEDDD